VKQQETALNRVLEFCKKNGIELKLMESQPTKDEETLIHIPGVKVIISYIKKDGLTSI
jgi:hypothetical protein